MTLFDHIQELAVDTHFDLMKRKSYSKTCENVSKISGELEKLIGLQKVDDVEYALGDAVERVNSYAYYLGLKMYYQRQCSFKKLTLQFYNIFFNVSVKKYICRFSSLLDELEKDIISRNLTDSIHKQILLYKKYEYAIMIQNGIMMVYLAYLDCKRLEYLYTHTIKKDRKQIFLEAWVKKVLPD